MSITKIVLTGGPCAGKTTLLSKAQEVFAQRGYSVLVVPEAATSLIPSGIQPYGPGGISMEKFQEFVMRQQLAMEENYDLGAKRLESVGLKVLILCDRGVMDGQGYVSKKAFDYVLDMFHLTRSSAFSRYDGVIHLVTAANGAEEAYTTSNNAARSETVGQARELDKKTMDAWVGHPHLRVIGNESDFQGKMNQAIRAITDILGDPVPMEVEKKYLIRRPDKDVLQQLGAVRSTLVQTYLTSVNSTERRVRQREFGGGRCYYYTEKEPCSSGGRIERERRISQSEYAALLTEADPACPVIVKERYCFVYSNRYFELDVYPTSDNQAIMEVELSGDDLPDTAIEPPPGITIIRDVTERPAYSNHEIALRGNRLPNEVNMDREDVVAELRSLHSYLSRPLSHSNDRSRALTCQRYNVVLENAISLLRE